MKPYKKLDISMCFMPPKKRWLLVWLRTANS